MLIDTKLKAVLFPVLVFAWIFILSYLYGDLGTIAAFGGLAVLWLILKLIYPSGGAGH